MVTFFISVKQIIESERKIRLTSVLHHSGVTLDSISKCSDEALDVSETGEEDLVPLEDLPTVQLTESEIQIVYFVAGYCAKRVQNNVNCPDCLNFFITDGNIPLADHPSDFFTSVNRGGLKAPANQVFVICCTAYEIFCRIKQSNTFDDFLRRKSSRSAFVSTVMN